MLQIDNVVYDYATRRRKSARGPEVRALNGVSLRLQCGETLGVIGETGSGKSTVGMLAVGQLRPLSGNVFFKDKPLAESWAPGNIQMVFQDPISSLNPRMKVEDILVEPLEAQGWGTRGERRDRAAALIERVGLRAEHLGRRRSEFSGGQCQRIAIARAIITHPEFIVLDEPTSSLDVIVQAKILKLLEEIQAEYHTGYMFISHNLAVVEAVADQVVVLYRGHVVEAGPAVEVLSRPEHPYTVSLANAVLGLDLDFNHESSECSQDTSAIALESLTQVLNGCPYQWLCPLRKPQCSETMPLLLEHGTRSVACHVVNGVH